MSFFFSVTSKYSVDEPIIYKLSEYRKTQVMKNQHALLKIKKTLLPSRKKILEYALMRWSQVILWQF